MNSRSQAEYVAVLMHLKHEVNRELDRAQVAESSRAEFLDALVNAQMAQRRYDEATR